MVNRVFADEFDACTSSWLYDELITAGLPVPQRVVDPSIASTRDTCAVHRVRARPPLVIVFDVDPAGPHEARAR